MDRRAWQTTWGRKSWTWLSDQATTTAIQGEKKRCIPVSLAAGRVMWLHSSQSTSSALLLRDTDSSQGFPSFTHQPVTDRRTRATASTALLGHKVAWKMKPGSTDTGPQHLPPDFLLCDLSKFLSCLNQSLFCFLLYALILTDAGDKRRRMAIAVALPKHSQDRHNTLLCNLPHQLHQRIILNIILLGF